MLERICELERIEDRNKLHKKLFKNKIGKKSN